MALLKRNKTNTGIDTDRLSKRKLLKESADIINVEVINITAGEVVCVNPKTREVITWEESGDTRVMTLEMFYDLYYSSKELFRTLALGVSEVYFGDALDVDLKDVLDSVDLLEIYSPFNYDIGDIDTIVVDYNIDEFNAFLDKVSRKIVERVCERYLYLKRSGYVNDPTKEKILSTLVEDNYIFTPNQA